MSTAYEICGGVLLVLDTLTAILLLIAMKKIFSTIAQYYPRWTPNWCFISLQIIAFIAPVMITCGCLIAYTPQANYYDTLTYEIMFLYCLFQASISIVMIILLYVVTTYSLSKEVTSG